MPNFVFDAGSLAGYLYDLVTVAAESTAAASVVNAVLLEQGLAAKLCNSLHVHEERLARGRSAPHLRWS